MSSEVSLHVAASISLALLLSCGSKPGDVDFMGRGSGGGGLGGSAGGPVSSTGGSVSASTGGEANASGGAMASGGAGAGGAAVGGSGATASGGSGAEGSGGTAAGGSGAAASGGSSTGGSGGASVGGSGTSGGSSGWTGGGGNSSCAPLGNAPAHVYVDRNSPMPSIGTSECPFHTVLEAAQVTSGVPLMIHVIGGTPTYEYAETDAIVLAPGVTLVGDGLEKVRISGHGNCGGRTCAVWVKSGAELTGVSVTSTLGDGVLLGAPGSVALAKMSSSRVSQCQQNGIVAQFTAEVGPDVSAINNGANGLLANATTTIRRVISAPSSHFDGNAMNGIQSVHSDVTVESGTADGNGLNGFRGVGGSYTIWGFQAFENGKANGPERDGIRVTAGSLHLRTTFVLKNAGAGLYFSGSTLDIGTPQAPGCNGFSATDSSLRNGAAGLCLLVANTQAADGNAWSTCTPNPDTQQSATGCYVGGYKDIKTEGVGTVSITACGMACN